MNYYDEIKEKLIKSEIYDKAKDYIKDKNKVKVYYEIGKLLHEAGKEYGKNIINTYSEKLILEVGKKYNKRTLFRMKQFYNLFKNQKVSPIATQLTWSHFTELLPIKDKNELEYYVNISIKQKLSRNDLRLKIKSKEYERLPKETKEKLLNEKKLEIKDIIPNPIILKANELSSNIKEYALKEIILNNLDDFLKQLGNSFCYIGNEYKIKIGNSYNYIDLLLYNYEFNCFVVIELKVTELKKEHIGQIQIYMNYIDLNLRKIKQDKTIGIIISKKDNKFVMEYCSDERIISRTYELL